MTCALQGWGVPTDRFVDCSLSGELPLTPGGSRVLGEEGTQTSFLRPKLSFCSQTSWRVGIIPK